MRTLLMLLMLAGPGLPTVAAAQSPEPAPVRLGPGDAVRVRIGSDAGRSEDFPVMEDGNVLLPVVGLVSVGGRPFPEVRAQVLEAYRRQLVETPVVLTPVLRIPVLGEVRQPGLMPVDPTLTLVDVLAAAGGLTPLGDPDRILLLRGDQTIRLSLDGEAGLLVQTPVSGDRLVVSRRSWLRENLDVVLAVGGSVLAAAVTSLVLR